jgi:hypothetical protein
MMKKIILGSVACLFYLLSAVPSFAGPTWEIGEDSWMKLSFLGQAHYAYQDDAAPETDFYLRRGRIILTGQIMDGVKFFAETDNDKAGKSGTTVSTDIQDAFVDIRLGGAGSDHWIKAGLILLPFSLETFSSAASLLGLDYNSETIKLTNTFVWRDNGVSVHGNFGTKVAYRAGFFDGYDVASKNPDAGFRFTGHVAFSVIGDVETGWFYTQDKQGKKGNYLTVGAGLDNQQDATISYTIAGVEEIDSRAMVVDVQSGFDLGSSSMGAMSLTANGAVYEWDNASFDGVTAFGEAGFRVGKAMGTFKFSTQRPDDGDEIDDITLGVHYFLKGHSVRSGIEFRTGDSDDMILAGIQFLL